MTIIFSRKYICPRIQRWPWTEHMTKMKKNLKYRVLSSIAYVSSDGLVTHKDERILFSNGDLEHESRRVELWSNDSHKSVTLLTNNFELSVRDIEEIYRR